MTDWVSTNLVRGRTPDRSDRPTLTGQTGLSRGRPKFVLHVKSIASRRRRTNLSQCKVGSEKVPAVNEVQVEDGKGKAQDAQKGPMIVEKSVNVSQKLVLANDHEASSSNLKAQDKEKYFQPRWCPPGLTHT